MGFKKGRYTNWTSNEVKRIYQELMRGNNEYQKDAMLCPNKKCKGGRIYNCITDKLDTCDTCDGWGIVRNF